MSGVWVDEKKNVLYSQAVRMKVFCLMDFGMYPFDEQKCKLRVGSYSYQDSKMSFVNKDITKYTKEDSPLPQKIDVIVFKDEETNIDYGALGNFSIAGCWINLSRSSSSFIASLYVPSGVLVLISLISFLVPAEERLCRFFLLLLPLSMVIYLQRSATFLVPNSSLTVLDVWMVSCIVFILIILIVQSGILMMKAHKREISPSNKSVDSVGLSIKSVDSISLLTLSLAFVIFIAVYAG